MVIDQVPNPDPEALLQAYRILFGRTGISGRSTPSEPTVSSGKQQRLNLAKCHTYQAFNRPESLWPSSTQPAAKDAFKGKLVLLIDQVAIARARIS